MIKVTRIVAALAITGLTAPTGVAAQGQQTYQVPMYKVDQTKPSDRCTLPPIAKSTKLVVFGAYEGDAASSAVIGSQDVETGVINIYVEPGDQPLYVVLTSYDSVIWRFQGAVNRVAQVVVSSAQGMVEDSSRKLRAVPQSARQMIVPFSENLDRNVSYSGVTGIDRKRVIIAYKNCIGYFYKVTPSERSRTSAVVEGITGRSPDLIFGVYSLSTVNLPSGLTVKADGKKATLPRGFDAETWEEAIRFWPGGLVRINPKQVVAAAPVQSYRVLPNQVGLSQLVGSGAITRLGSDRFRVIRPIAHMPPSMGGAHSVTLRFAPGVPIPPGDPVHSCIVNEGARTEHGARCRSSD